MIARETKPAHQKILISLLLTTSEKSIQQGFIAELYLFFIRYLFLFEQSSNKNKSCVAKTPQFNAPQGNIYMGARYLDPKYSRWISTDPALGEYVPQAPVNDEAKKHNQNLPGMGGIFNSVNLSLFHYAANNPVRYVDPDGAFNWDNNTVQEGDCLSKIAFECNIRYGTNYTDDDLQSLNPNITNKHFIKTGEHLNLGIAEEKQKLAKDYINRVTTRYPDEILSFPQKFQEADTLYYSRPVNFIIGLGEIFLGIASFAGSTISAGEIEVGTAGVGSYYAGLAVLEGYATGALFLGYGITRLTGANKQSFKDDINSILVIPEVDIATSINESQKRRNE